MITGDDRFDLQVAREANRLIMSHPRKIPASSLSGAVAFLLERWDELEGIRQERDVAQRKLESLTTVHQEVHAELIRAGPKIHDAADRDHAHAVRMLVDAAKAAAITALVHPPPTDQRLQIAVQMMAAMIASGDLNKSLSHKLLEACAFEIADDMLSWPKKETP